jgi:hypothetical protein
VSRFLLVAARVASPLALRVGVLALTSLAEKARPAATTATNAAAMAVHSIRFSGRAGIMPEHRPRPTPGIGCWG